MTFGQEENETAQSEALHTYNPKGRPKGELPFIYGFNNGGSPGWFTAVAMGADGEYLGSHICSAESFMPDDLGLTPYSRRQDRVDFYENYYSDGYRTAFVGYEDIDGHKGLQAAFAASDARRRDLVEDTLAEDAGLVAGVVITTQSDSEETE